MTPEWHYTVTYHKFEGASIDEWHDLQTDMDQMAMDGWEMVNAAWKPGTAAANPLATIFWRKRVGSSADE